MERIINFINSIYQISGTPIFYFDSINKTLTYCIGIYGSLKIDESAADNILSVLKTKKLFILSQSKGSENILYVLPVHKNEIISGALMIAAERKNYFSADERKPYIHILNIINLFLNELETELLEIHDIDELVFPGLPVWAGLLNTGSEQHSASASFETHYIEKNILHSVVTGNLYTLKKELEEYIPKAIETLYSPQRELRRKKNTLITMTTMVFIETIRAGVPAESALRMLNRSHSRIESLKDFTNAGQLIEEILTDFCSRINSEKSKNLLRYVNFCIDYVSSHIYEKITLDEIASKLGLHPSYLSALFTHEYGQNFSVYYAASKVEEAKKLILYSQMPFSEIAAKLTFTDQSHFSKCFKKYTGMTPKQYRQSLAPDKSSEPRTSPG